MYSKEFTIGWVANVRPFVQVVERYIEDVDIARGRYTLDAKSIMAIMSLDISKPVHVSIHTDDSSIAEKLFKELEEVLGK